MDGLLANYAPSDSVKKLVQITPLLLLVGISGAGKDSIKKKLLETGRFHDFVSYTTRPPRRNNGILEEDGKDYHFVTHEQMQDLLKNGEMIEAKQYSGNVYGTGASDLQQANNAGKIALNDIEVQGVAEYKAIAPNVKAVFLLPPSFDMWRKRFVARYGDENIDEDDWQKRLSTARTELQHALDAGYYEFVVNDNLDDATAEVIACANGEHDIALQQAGEGIAHKLLAELS